MIMEFRTYRMQPGTRAEFVAYFESEAIPRMREVGMNVVGQFSSINDENVFAYARTFDSIEQREQQYLAFYQSEDWLGWMIDVAIGKEESFEVFLGSSQGESSPPDLPLSGVHAARFELVSIVGTVTEMSAQLVAVVDGDGRQKRFRPHPRAQVFACPHGRGMMPAEPATLGKVSAGDRVLVLGEQTADGPVARQIVHRPPATGES